MDFDQLVLLVQTFVNRIFTEKLPHHLHFHNAVHTGYVVLAAREIGIKTGLSAKEMEIVTLAAWFHDTGYTRVYKGHEEVSMEIATNFLSTHGVAGNDLIAVQGCIMATKFPQRPKNLVEQVICDADFYHFSVDHYLHFARVLKMEWEEELGLKYTQREWDLLNLEMLQSHQYFTPYSKNVLQVKKEKNIEFLKQLHNP